MDILKKTRGLSSPLTESNAKLKKNLDLAK